MDEDDRRYLWKKRGITSEVKLRMLKGIDASSILYGCRILIKREEWECEISNPEGWEGAAL